MLLKGEAYVEIATNDTTWRRLLEIGEEYIIPPLTIHRFVAKTDCVIREIVIGIREDIIRLL